MDHPARDSQFDECHLRDANHNSTFNQYIAPGRWSAEGLVSWRAAAKRRPAVVTRPSRHLLIKILRAEHQLNNSV